MAEDLDTKLPDLFEKIWDNYAFTDSSEKAMNSDEMQSAVRTGVAACEQAIDMTNKLSLFSSNEEISDVTTNEIRYLLLPALLAHFTMLQTQLDRLTCVSKAKTYFKDYLRLCRLYHVSKQNIPGSTESDDEPEKTEKDKQQSQAKSVTSCQATRPPDLAAMTRDREAKIQRYKQQKQRTEKLKELYPQVQKPHVDDEIKREYYLTLLEKWITSSIEEMENIATEIEILEHMGKRMATDGACDNAANNRAPTKPVRPFIITKNDLQKKVFGAGYPSFYSCTIEEFIEQKMREGTIGNSGLSLQDIANDPEKRAADIEKEDIEKDEAHDDPDNLAQARGWDEWKDDHRRGWGNRQNMG